MDSIVFKAIRIVNVLKTMLHCIHCANMNIPLNVTHPVLPVMADHWCCRCLTAPFVTLAWAVWAYHPPSYAFLPYKPVYLQRIKQIHFKIHVHFLLKNTRLAELPRFFCQIFLGVPVFCVKSPFIKASKALENCKHALNISASDSFFKREVSGQRPSIFI